MQEMTKDYAGPHHIVLNRNEKNLGLASHYNKFMGLASGEIVELAAGDDISLADRTTRSVRILSENPSLTSVSLGLIRFEGAPPKAIPPEQGPEQIQIVDLSQYIADLDCHLNAPARAFRKHTHDYFGPLIAGGPSEDSPNLFRCFLHGKGASSSKAGVLYRIHGNNVWASANKFKISIPRIHEELEHTLKVAYEKRLIDAKTYAWIHEGLKRRLAQRLVIMKMEASNSKLVAFMVHCLPSRCFSVGEKMRRFYYSVRTSLA
jgi:hypothetical protein